MLWQLYMFGKGQNVYILEQLFTAKGYEYIVAVLAIFVFIAFYKFLNRGDADEEE